MPHFYDSQNGYLRFFEQIQKRIINRVLDSSNQIQIRIFEIHNLSVFFGGEMI